MLMNCYLVAENYADHMNNLKSKMTYEQFIITCACFFFKTTLYNNFKIL